MPAAIPLIAGAFLAAGTVATAVGVTLGVAFTIGATAVTWAAVATITGVALMGVAMLTMKTPKPASSGGQLDSKLDVRAPVPVAYGRTATGGFISYQQSFGSKNAFLAMVAVLSAGPVQAIESHRANDSLVYYSGNPTSGLATSTGVGDGSKLYKNKLRSRYQLGEAPASQTITQATGLPLPGSPGKLSGLAHAITVMEYSTDAFPQGVPKNLWVLQGAKLYDPRRDSTYPGGSGSHRRDNPATWQYSENPFLAALDWTLGRWWNGKKVYGIGARLEEVEVSAFVSGANVADANGWKIGGVVTTDDNKFAVLSTLLQSGGGVPIARGAQISCLVNAPKTSAFTLTSADVIGEVELMNSTSWRDRSNTVVPTYREESQLWALIAGEQVSSATFVEEDAGEKKIVEVQYPLVQQAAQAHQLATYDLCNSREMLTCTVTCKVRALNVRSGDAILVNIPEVGANNFKFLVTGREFNPADLTVTLSLKSETDSKHPFSLGQSQVAPAAPALDGYNPSAPGAPAATAWSITGTQITKDGTSIPAIVINGEADDPNTDQIVVDYRPVGDPVWKNWGSFARTTTQIELTAVTSATAYEVGIAYRTVRGVLSDRLVLNSTAGAMKVDWGKVVSGTGKPADNADVTKDNTAKDTFNVGGRPATDLLNDVSQIKSDAAAALAAAKASMPDTTPPGAPSNLNVSSVLTGDAGADFTWTWTAPTTGTVTGYDIQIKEGAGGFIGSSSPTPSFKQRGLRGTIYTAKVRALASNGVWGNYTAEKASAAAVDNVGPGPVSAIVVDPRYDGGMVTFKTPADADFSYVTVNLISSNNLLLSSQVVMGQPDSTMKVSLGKLTAATTYSVNITAYDTSKNPSSTIVSSGQFKTAGGISASEVTPDLLPPATVATLPAAAGYSGARSVFNQADGKLYFYVSGAWQAAKAEAVGDVKLQNNSVKPEMLVDGAIIARTIQDGVIDSQKLTPTNRKVTSTGLNIRVDADGVLRWNDASVNYTRSDGTMAIRRIVAGSFAAGNGVVRLYYYVGDDGTNTNLDSRQNNDLSLDNNSVYRRVATWSGGSDLVVEQGFGQMINADRVVAGTIKTEHLAAGSITAEKLVLSGGRGSALNADPNFIDNSIWRNTPGASLVKITNGIAGATAIQLTSAGTAIQSADKIAIDRNKAYRFHGYARRVSGSFGLIYMGIALADAEGNNIVGDGTFWYYCAAGNKVGTDWTLFEGAVGAGYRPFPANARSMSIVLFGNYPEGNPAQNDSVHQFQDCRIEEVIPGSLIVAGTITGTHIAGGTITGDKIKANEITANKLTISSRPVSTTGINIRVEEDNVVRWNEGAIIYQLEDGSYVRRYIGPGTLQWGGWGKMIHICYNATTLNGNLGVYYPEDVVSGQYGQQIPIASWNSGKDFQVRAGTSTQINGDQIVTGSIKAGSLAIGNTDNIVPDGDFRDPKWWNSNVADGRLDVGEVPFTQFRRALFIRPGGGIDVFSAYFPVEPGATYRVTVGVDTFADGFSGYFHAYLHFPGFYWYALKSGVAGNDPSSPPEANIYRPNYSDTVTYVFTVPFSLNTRQLQFRLMGSWTGTCRFATKIVRVSDTTIIQDGAITTDKIFTEAITADKIKVGSIGAAQISTGAITASKLFVGSLTDLNIDPGFRDVDMWANNGAYNGPLLPGPAFGWYNNHGQDINAVMGTSQYVMLWSGYYTSAARQHLFSAVQYNFKGGETYEFSAFGNNASNQPMIIYFRTWAADGTYLGDEGITFPVGQPAQKLSKQITPYANAASYQFIVFNEAAGPNFSGHMECTNISVMRVSGATAIQDGAITTNKITVGTLNGDRISAGTLDASKITAGSVLAGTVKVGSSSLNDIAAKADNSSPLTWVQFQGVYTINGNLVTKTGGGDAWDYNAIVEQPLRGTFILTGKFPSQATFFGVRQARDLSTYGGFEYSWHRSSNGDWYIFESGSAIWNGTSGAGVTFNDNTIFKIEHVGNVVNYWADNGLIRSRPSSPNLTWWAQIDIATPGASVRLLSWSQTSDNSLVNTDPAARINAYSSTIDPGKILISGGTSLANWRSGSDNTKIEGGNIAANSIKANSLSIGNRGISFIGLNFEWNPTNNWVYWSDGYIYWTDDNNNPASVYVAAGNTGGAGAHQWFYWNKGFGRLDFNQENPATAPEGRVFIGAWWGGSNLNINYGGTIINGDRITTNSINANRIVAGSITADKIAGSTITADKLAVGSLSAITGTIGLLRTAASGQRMELSNNGLSGYFDNGNQAFFVGIY